MPRSASAKASASVPTGPFCDVERRDGRQLTDEDEDALLEFGGLFHVWTALEAFASVPLIDGGIHGEEDPDLSRIGERAGQKRCHSDAAHPAIARRDGSPMSEDDDMALLEFGGYLAFFELLSSVLQPCPASYGVFPAEDDDLTEVGIKWGKQESKAPRHLERTDQKPMTTDDDEALIHYGAWVWIGTTMMSIYHQIFGSLSQISETATKPVAGIRRTPSGAELSATLGRTIKQSIGLDDPKRKVRTRGTL